MQFMFVGLVVLVLILYKFMYCIRLLPCYVILCYVILCYIMLYYVMLCYVMLCHVMTSLSVN